MRRLSLFATALFIAAAAPADAATWSPPQQVAGPGGVASPHAAFGRAGKLTVTWSGFDDGPDCQSHCSPAFTTAVSTRTGGVWSRPAPIGPQTPFAATAIGADGAGGTVIVGAIGLSEFETARAAGAATGNGGEPLDLSASVSGNRASDVAGVVGRRGDAIVTWAPAYVARRAPRGSFGPPKRLLRTGSVKASALNDRGDAVVVASQKGTWQIRIARRGKPFGRPVSFRGAASEVPRTIAATIDSQRRVTVFVAGSTPQEGYVRAYRWTGKGKVQRYALASFERTNLRPGLKATSFGAQVLATWTSGNALNVTGFRGTKAITRRLSGVADNFPIGLDALADGRAGVLLADGRVVLRGADGKLSAPETAAVVDSDLVDLDVGPLGAIALDPASGQPSVAYAAVERPESGPSYRLLVTDRQP